MRQKGFTLIEILVVIVVFGVGILAILTMLTNSIGYFDIVNMQTRATMLAKESLDLAYAHRDSNLEQGYPRNYVTWTENTELFWKPGEKYKLGFSSDNNYYLLQKIEKQDQKSDFQSNFETFRVVYHTGDNKPDHYRYLDNWEVIDTTKGFARRIEFSKIEWGDFSPNKLIKISSHALYQRWATTGEVVLEWFIGLKDSKVEDDSQAIN